MSAEVKAHVLLINPHRLRRDRPSAPHLHRHCFANCYLHYSCRETSDRPNGDRRSTIKRIRPKHGDFARAASMNERRTTYFDQFESNSSDVDRIIETGVMPTVEGETKVLQHFADA